MKMDFQNQKKLIKILNQAVKNILPPKKIKPSDWVEKNLKFCDGELQGSPMRLYEFQKQPLDSIIEPGVRKVVLMSSAQLLKTTIVTGASLYFLQHDPSNMVIAGTTANTVKKYKNGKYDPTIQLTPSLSKLITSKSDKTKTNDATTQETTVGTFNYFVSLSSPSTLRGLTAKRVFCDEISGVDTEGDEGNPIALVSQRCESFRDSLIMMCSTPLVPDDPICQEFAMSDQRYFHVPCPKCGDEQRLIWENVKFKWKVIDGGRRSIPDADTAYLECPHCKHQYTEAERVRSVSQGRWIATNPEIKDVRGYHISRLYSPVSSIRKLVQDFAEAFKNFDHMRFVNNALGEPYIDKENVEHDLTLLEQLRDFDIDIQNIPNDCVGLAYAVDQQLDRLECTLVGISEKNYYVLDHRSFYAVDCNKYDSPAYAELQSFINNTKLKTKNGTPLRVLQVWVDSSNGAATNTIYRFCNKTGNEIYKPIKGDGRTTIPLYRESTSGGYKFMLLNVNEGKNRIRKLLNAAMNDEAHEGKRIHFSHSLPDDAFLQYTSEKRVMKGGQLVWIKRTGSKDDRNEMLDTLNYCLISFEYMLNKLGVDAYKKLWNYNTNIAKAKYSEETQTNDTPKEHVPVRKARKRRMGGRNWFNE
ncbi:terminase gpA endonuclease subunit [Klebsiella variicola]|uniref:terminase gpA endonuclease subunit n=1 Tax=Klebsiella variicola TaxID=244366 RepID=UPI00164DC3F1|nr:terminase gpA endonuclease subunit [Klebsiella variicola]